MNTKLFLKNDIIRDTDMSTEEVFAYVGIRKVMSEWIPIVNANNMNKTMYLSAEQLCFSLTGKFIDQYIEMLQTGLKRLISRGLIFPIEEISQRQVYIVDVSSVYLNTANQYFTIIEDWEIKKILTWNNVKYISTLVSRMRYFIVLISTFNHSKSEFYGEGKVGHMSIEYIASHANISEKSAKRYNKDLEEMQLIYAYRTNDKYLIDGHFRQIKNTYSRYADKGICNMFAFENEKNGYIHTVVQPVKNKQQADYNRSLGAKYRALVKWHTKGVDYKYDESTIRDIYKYVANKNAKIQKLISEKEDEIRRTKSKTKYDEDYLNNLKEQIRDISFLDEYKDEHPTEICNNTDRLLSADENGLVYDNKNDIYWGEPNKMDNVAC